MKFHMFMFMNAWMMLVLMKCRCQMQSLTLGCYSYRDNFAVSHHIYTTGIAGFA